MMQKYLDESGFFNKDTLKLTLSEKSLTLWVKKFGVIGEKIVADAFASGGFGKWKPSK